MTRGHVIDLALDLARMPTLARTSMLPAIPPDIVELMRIAAASPEACQAAVAQTGEPVSVVIEASRFYLQQVLFRPDADCYRILGIEPTTPRETARSHMRWLLQWLHPDRNNNSWDAIYAERVLKAWREVSASEKPANPNYSFVSSKKRVGVAAIRVPWIKQPIKRRSLTIQSSYRGFIIWVVPTGLMIIFLALWSAGALLRP